jgi:eukaryotic-like serine/threonine-protein kinase
VFYALAARDQGQEDQFRLSARAAALAPSGNWATLYATQLIAHHRLDEARSVAARTHSVALEVDLAVAEAHFDAALRLAQAELDRQPATRIGLLKAAALFRPVVELNRILGRPQAFAAAVYARYVAPTPAQVGMGAIASASLLGACTSAPSPVGSACLHRLGELAGQGEFAPHLPGGAQALEGAARYVEGDLAGAARAWRPLVASGGVLLESLREPMVAAFEASGDSDLAAKLDAATLTAPGRYGSVDLAWVREAHRAERRGDNVRARELARQVVDAWGVADDTVPAVAEMKLLLERAR